MSGAAAAVFLVQRIGPYHRARLRAWAASRSGAVSVIEFRPGDTVYAWDTVETGGDAYRRVSTRSREDLIRALDELRPEVIVCTGYADVEVHQAMAWAIQQKVPSVTCSDSTFEDESRSWTRENLKRFVVGAFDAALVAGSRAHEYLGSLGVEAARCFQPWDVVDNCHFARGADQSRGDRAAVRTKLKLPALYFLCVARFVAKKNLERLIDAYAGYVARKKNDAWSLVLSGGGPLESELRARVTAANLDALVNFPGFLQYPDLPAYYGLAGAFVLPSRSDQWGLVVNEAMAAGLPVLVSSRCGCAPDLVRDGENGFTFDPEDSAALTGRLTQMADLDPGRLAAMGQRSRQIVRAFSPEAFARALEDAVVCALARPRSRHQWFKRALTNLLAMRSAAPR